MGFGDTPADWDQRQLFNARLHELFMNADKCSINDDYDNWYDSLRGVKRMINAFLDEKERVVIEVLVNDARRWSKVSGKRSLLFDRSLVQDKLDELHTKLYDYAHKYKLLLPRTDSTDTGFSRRLKGGT